MEGRSGTTSLVEYAAATTTGPFRGLNEDAFGVFEESNVFIVADGCGGRSSGRIAADLTVASFAHPRPARDLGFTEADPLVLAVLTANADVFREGQTKADLKGQGATVCAVRVSHGSVSIVHVGDCRVGRCREGRFDWLTEDHSLVAELRKSGAPPKEIARVAKAHSNVILRVVGVAESVEVELAHHPALSGDLYLLCTDGLTRQVEQVRISELLGVGVRSLRERCAALLHASESAGGHDNATVLLLQLR